MNMSSTQALGKPPSNNALSAPSVDYQLNALGQAVGSPLPHWDGCQRPLKAPMYGQYCDLLPLNAGAHAEDLFAAFTQDTNRKNWTYLLSEPCESLSAFRHDLQQRCKHHDTLFFTVINKASGKAVGLAAFLRIDPKQGVIEVGHVHFSLQLQKTSLATEAMFLMMQTAFDTLGYRRYEWKCDNGNAPSKRAAQRLGFTFEGVFRQAIVYKGRNRDTAWFSILDKEWPALKKGFTAWLSPNNMNAQGQQVRSLQACIVSPSVSIPQGQEP